MRCMVPQPSTAAWNRSYPDFWVVTSNPQYPGYKTSIVAPEPSVKWVARAVHSIGGRIGTHMLLCVPSWDSVVRTWG
jgi:hypothetical protein